MIDAVAQGLFAATNALTAATFFALGLVTSRRKPTTPQLRSWSILCLLTGCFATSLMLTVWIHSPWLALATIKVGFTFGTLALLSLLRFIVSFAQPPAHGRKLLVVGTIWASVLLVLFWGTDLVVAGITHTEYAVYGPLLGPLIPAYGGYLAYNWLVSLALSIMSFRRSTGRRRIQTGYVLLAFGFGAVSTSSTLLPAFLGTYTLVAIVPALFIPLFPLTITYAIVRHRLWDVRTIIHRTFVWLLLTILLFVPLFVVLLLGTDLWPRMSRLDQAVALTTVFLLANAWLRAAKPKLDHMFQRRDFDQVEVVAAFGQAMVGLVRPDDVARTLLSTLEETLYPETAIVAFRRDGHTLWTEIDAQEVQHGSGPVDVAAFLAALASHCTAVDREQIDTDLSLLSVRDEARRYFESTDAQVLTPLVHGGRLLGIIRLGEKRNLQPYSRGDLEFLDRIGAAAAVGLTNAVLFERVDRQRQALSALTETLEQRVVARTRDLELVNTKLSLANDSLRDLDRMKSRFFANISHELRTPLTMILAPVEAMLGGEFGHYDAGQREHLGGIRRSAFELLKLVEDLLDLSRLEDCRLRLRLAPTDVGELVGRMVDFARPLARRKDIALDFETPGAVVAEVDAPKLERVLVNLVSNALKFSDVGGRVHLKLTADEQQVVIAVEDSGIGIESEALENIFNRFWQVDASITRRHGGSGIGLSLARELAELHGGGIEVISEPGTGSTFTVRLPLRADELPPHRIERRQQQEPVDEVRRTDDLGLPEWSDAILTLPEYRFLGIDRATERRVLPRGEQPRLTAARILAVDDSADVLQFLHRVLGDRYELWTAPDGAQGWESLLKHRHDLVISDVMMPGMSGLELCHRVKSEPDLQEIPVILLTARSGVEHRIEAHAVGADKYLSKPFNAGELRAAIEGLLAGRTRRIETAARRRSASLETLLAGLAHELRNACQQARGAQDVVWTLVRRVPPESLEERDAVSLARMEGIARRALDRIAAVVQSLQSYASTRMQLPWSDHNFDELVRGAVEHVGGAGDREIAIKTDLNCGDQVRGPAEELRQMVINLVENAVHAVADDGQITVTTTSEAGVVRLVVEDDGCGIPAEHRDRVFDLFFTTRDPGLGTGLGLALCQRTASDVGGAISVRSEVGAGTAFSVELPSIRQARQSRVPATAPLLAAEDARKRTTAGERRSTGGASAD